MTFAELFFDLVFVFAITQLAHHLLEHLSLKGVIETGLLLLAVWTVWVYSTWAINWLDADHDFVRFLLFVMMGAGLVLSTTLPEAFGRRGLVFASAYVFMQVGRQRSRRGRSASTTARLRGTSSAFWSGCRWPAPAGSPGAWPKARRE